MTIRRALPALCAVFGLCACREPRPAPAPKSPSAPAPAFDPSRLPDPAPPPAPGFRLPEGASPLAYDLRLELDPDRETFRGRVSIRVRLDAPADRVWMHAVELSLESARFRAAGGAADATEPLVPGDAHGGMRALSFGRTLPAGEVVLELAYTGVVGDGEAEGLFRQRAGGRWYLFSQSESVFARRITPCFDEPRFKVPWRVTIVAPDGLAALANAPLLAEARLPDGRREHRFAEIGPMPSYLVAVAVGPFALVDAGRVGRGRVPVRAAVPPGDVQRTAAIAAWTPRLVDALERYLDQPFPAAKLDLVAVPRFFGAMENTGLVTFQSSTLLGDPTDPAYLRRFVRFLAHELAHHWFGNAVTPAWWDDLWLSEAFATWLDDKLGAALGPLDDAPLRTQLSRAQALAADRAPGAHPLRRTIASEADAEDAFDAISYEKGAAVLSMLEGYLGEARFRDAVRAYLRARAGGTATAADVQAALAAVDPAAAAALAGYLDRAGAPVVDLSLSCASAGPPLLTAAPRGSAPVPVCVRYPGRTGPATTCGLAAPGGAALALPAAAGCPSWIAGNADGRGYYHVGRAPASPPAPPPAERLAAGHDRAAAVARGELAAAPALSEIRTLLAARDPYAALAALAIASELDLVVAEADRPAWYAWLGARLGPRLGAGPLLAPRTPAERALRDAILPLVPAAYADRAAVQTATTAVDAAIARAADGSARRREAHTPSQRADAPELWAALALAAPAGGGALLDRLLPAAVAAAAAGEPGRSALFLSATGSFGPDLASRAVDIALDGRFPVDAGAAGLAALLARGQTRTAAWRALRPRLRALIPRLAGGSEAMEALLDAAGGLCDATARAELAAGFASDLSAIPDARRPLERALAQIDACIARRAALGDLAAALR